MKFYLFFPTTKQATMSAVGNSSIGVRIAKNPSRGTPNDPRTTVAGVVAGGAPLTFGNGCGKPGPDTSFFAASNAAYARDSTIIKSGAR
jgi:hypothetical protein